MVAARVESYHVDYRSGRTTYTCPTAPPWT